MDRQNIWIDRKIIDGQIEHMDRQKDSRWTDRKYGQIERQQMDRWNIWIDRKIIDGQIEHLDRQKDNRWIDRLRKL